MHGNLPTNNTYKWSNGLISSPCKYRTVPVKCQPCFNPTWTERTFVMVAKFKLQLVIIAWLCYLPEWRRPLLPLSQVWAHRCWFNLEIRENVDVNDDFCRANRSRMEAAILDCLGFARWHLVSPSHGSRCAPRNADTKGDWSRPTELLGKFFLCLKKDEIKYRNAGFRPQRWLLFWEL